MAVVVLYHPPLEIGRLSGVVLSRCFATQNVYIKDVRHMTYPIKKAPIHKCMGAFGSSPGKTRTCDKSVNSRLLYQLSYRGLGCFDLKLYSRLIRQRRSAYGGVYQLSYRG